MAGLDDFIEKTSGGGKNGEEKKDFVDRLEEKETKRKERLQKLHHPYSYLRYSILLLIGVPAFIILFTVFSLNSNSPNLMNYFSVFSGFIYIYSLVFIIAQEVLNNITYILGLSPIIIPMETISYYPIIFKKTIETPMLFSINPMEFRDNLLANMDFVFTHLSAPVNRFGNTAGFLLLTFAQVYLINLVVYHVIKFAVGKQGRKNSVELMQGYLKILGDPSKMDEADKIKSEIMKRSNDDSFINIRFAFKEFFLLVDPAACGRLEPKLNKGYKSNIVKKDFFEQIMDVFNKNIPTKYYNIINFQTKEDLRMFKYKSEKNEDTLKLKQYTQTDLDEYKKIFNQLNSHLMLPMLMARLRSYRTYDLHNLFTYGKKNPEMFFLNKATPDEINKLQRMSKEGYKLFHNPKENQDSTTFSIELRYPYSFSLQEIDTLEKIREDIKKFAGTMVLKYLSSDTNMHVYSVAEEGINDTAYQYFNMDMQTHIQNILEFNDTFFETLKNNKKYTWIPSPEGEKLKDLMVKMIHLNFNPNIFLETLQELNSSHFKSLYFMEEPISTKDIQKIFTVLKDTNLKLHEFKGTHEPIPDVVFLTKLNLGYFRMLSLGQDFLGTITDENKVNSFLDEFKIEYTRLK